MGKILERKKRKKKGRPSLLDIQKRSLKEQHQQQLQLSKANRKKTNSHKSHHHLHTNSLPNYKSPTPTTLRRSTRRNPAQEDDVEDEDEDEEDEELSGKRREKKLKLVLKLPSNEKLDPNSASDASNSNATTRKRKIDAIGDGSGTGGRSTSEAINAQEMGPSTPLPDEKLLLFILDRLQKKDTYGVFSEPVDSEDLPDYHEVIEHPMDFGTIRDKLSRGSYSNLEQFEKDVFLICSNAMQYNAPDTIYFRQARSIQELAKKDFENLRQDSDDNEPETKVVRRGRPPTKNLKKSLGRLQLDRAGSEFSEATLATGPERPIVPNIDTRKEPASNKSGLVDSSAKFSGSRNDAFLLSEFERSDEATGSIFKGVKHGRRPGTLEDSRRNTYRQFHTSAVTREASVLTTFDAERKQLMAVGLMSEHGYARSLARFAANIGTVAWKIASKRIERSLPPGVDFGPGWVGENDSPPSRPLLPSLSSSAQLSPLWPLSLPNCASSAVHTTNESKEEKLLGIKDEYNFSDRQLPSLYSARVGRSSGSLSSHSPASHLGAIKSDHGTERPEQIEGSVSHAGSNVLNRSVGVISTMPPLQFHQSPLIRPGINGFNGMYGCNLPPPSGKAIGATRLPGSNFPLPQMVERVSRTNHNVVQSATTGSLLNSGDAQLPDNAGGTCAWPESVSEVKEASTSGLQPQSSHQGFLPQSANDPGLPSQQILDSVPPDLNVRFQGPGSPSSNRLDPGQPDLALQL